MKRIATHQLPVYAKLHWLWDLGLVLSNSLTLLTRYLVFWLATGSIRLSKGRWKIIMDNTDVAESGASLIFAASPTALTQGLGIMSFMITLRGSFVIRVAYNQYILNPSAFSFLLPFLNSMIIARTRGFGANRCSKQEDQMKLWRDFRCWTLYLGFE